MPRQPRGALGDGLFHVTARGNAGMKIYLDEADYRTFLAPMRHVATQHAWTLFTYNPVRAGLVADADEYPWSARLVTD